MRLSYGQTNQTPRIHTMLIARFNAWILSSLTISISHQLTGNGRIFRCNSVRGLTVMVASYRFRVVTYRGLRPIRPTSERFLSVKNTSYEVRLLKTRYRTVS